MTSIAVLQDIIWLAIYSTVFLSFIKQPYLAEFNSYYEHYEFGIQKYEVIVSWIFLIIKVY